ncbi:MAG: hypothetical protein ABW061_11030 [Polyangiaceae bacterium]
MLRVLGRRGFEACISLFAILGFCYVPLGSHTGLEHAKAIFSTPAAKRAGLELVQAFSRMRGKLTGEAEEIVTGAATPTAPHLSPAHKPSGAAHPEQARRSP